MHLVVNCNNPLNERKKHRISDVNEDVTYTSNDAESFSFQMCVHFMNVHYSVAILRGQGLQNIYGAYCEWEYQSEISAQFLRTI